MDTQIIKTVAKTEENVASDNKGKSRGLTLRPKMPGYPEPHQKIKILFKTTVFKATKDDSSIIVLFAAIISPLALPLLLPLTNKAAIMAAILAENHSAKRRIVSINDEFYGIMYYIAIFRTNETVKAVLPQSLHAPAITIRQAIAL